MTSGLFALAEYQARLEEAQTRMAEGAFDALLLTTEADLRYFTGYMTRFWESPTRPWFLVLPAQGAPIAVIPTIGAALMRSTWIEDIRTWRSPDYADDGVSLLIETLQEVTKTGARIATPGGNGTYLRMPLEDWARVQTGLSDRRFVHDDGCVAAQRMIKSEAEITRIKLACGIARRAFQRVPEIAHAGVPLSDVFRRFQMLCLSHGADWVPYLAGGAGPGGYRDVISPATSQALTKGDVLMLDTGLLRDGYFCDFDRNFSVGTPAPKVVDAFARLLEATHAAFDMARPGCRVSDLFDTMDKIVTNGAGWSDAGRLGHGLGMQLTEPPSLLPEDHTLLQPGMVLTLEPGIDMGDGRIMVHEENIVIRPDGAEWMSGPALPKMVELH